MMFHQCFNFIFFCNHGSLD